MTKKEGRLLALVGLFLGMVLGFMMAPIKAGISCGNNNTVYGNKVGGRHRISRKASETPEDGEDLDCEF